MEKYIREGQKKVRWGLANRLGVEFAGEVNLVRLAKGIIAKYLFSSSILIGFSQKMNLVKVNTNCVLPFW